VILMINDNKRLLWLTYDLQLYGKLSHNTKNRASASETPK
jgi:hypothetical protein